MARGAKLNTPVIDVTDQLSQQDELNQSIIALLKHDGRRPYSEIANKLGVSEGTIRNRVTSMKKEGMLRIVAIADPVSAEYKSDAMLGIKVAPGHSIHAVSERLAQSRDVVYILWVTGRYDLLVEIVSNNRDNFLKFLDDQVHSKEDIVSCETMSGLKNFKNQFLLKQNWE